MVKWRNGEMEERSEMAVNSSQMAANRYQITDFTISPFHHFTISPFNFHHLA